MEFKVKNGDTGRIECVVDIARKIVTEVAEQRQAVPIKIVYIPDSVDGKGELITHFKNSYSHVILLQEPIKDIFEMYVNELVRCIKLSGVKFPNPEIVFDDDTGILESSFTIPYDVIMLRVFDRLQYAQIPVVKDLKEPQIYSVIDRVLLDALSVGKDEVTIIFVPIGVISNEASVNSIDYSVYIHLESCRILEISALIKSRYEFLSDKIKVVKPKSNNTKSFETLKLALRKFYV